MNEAKKRGTVELFSCKSCKAAVTIVHLGEGFGFTYEHAAPVCEAWDARMREINAVQLLLVPADRDPFPIPWDGVSVDEPVAKLADFGEHGCPQCGMRAPVDRDHAPGCRLAPAPAATLTDIAGPASDTG